MSQILRALGRGKGSPHRTSAPPSHDNDAVLAGLGVRPPRRAPTKRRRAVLLALSAVVALAAGALVAKLTYEGSFPRSQPNPGAYQAVRSPASLQVEPVREIDTPAPPASAEPRPQATHAQSSESPRPDAPASSPATTATATSARPPAPRPGAAATTESRARAAAEGSRRPAELTVASAPSGPPIATASREDHFKLAMYYHRAGDFEKALVQYRALLKQDELNAEAHNNLGLLFKEKGLVEDALGEFRRAIFINADYAVARNNLAVTLLEAGRPEAAVAELRAIVAADADNADARVNLALALHAMKQSGAAQEELMRAIGIDADHAAAHYNLGRLYDDDREVSKALDHYRKFLMYAGAEHAAVVPGVRSRVAVLEQQIG